MSCSETFFSTDTIAHSLRDEFWREITQPFCDTTLVARTGAATLEGSMRIRHLGGLTLGATAFNAQRYRRDKTRIARTGLDHYLVHVMAAGAIYGDFAGKSVRATEGSIFIIDLARPYDSQVDAGRRLATTVPRAGLERLLGARDLHGFSLPAGNAMTRLLVDYLCGFHTVVGQLSASEGVAAQDALITLLAAGLSNTPPAPDAPTSILGQALRARVLAFIDRHLMEADLGPDLLMQRFHVSRAHLYRAFVDQGGVVNVIRRKRLDAVYARLLDPRSTRRPMSRIANDFGFSDMGRFRKAFVARFGLQPDEARESGHHPSAASDDSNFLSRHFALHQKGPLAALAAPQGQRP